MKTFLACKTYDIMRHCHVKEMSLRAVVFPLFDIVYYRKKAIMIINHVIATRYYQRHWKTRTFLIFLAVKLEFGNFNDFLAILSLKVTIMAIFVRKTVKNSQNC